MRYPLHAFSSLAVAMERADIVAVAMDHADIVAADVHAEPMPNAEPPPPPAVPPAALPAGGAHAAAQAAAAAVREVYETQRKSQAVIVDGFVMIKHYISANGEVQHWRCEFVNKLKCPARGESVAGTTAVVMRQKYARHNHEPDATARKVQHMPPWPPKAEPTLVLGSQDPERSQGPSKAPRHGHSCHHRGPCIARSR